VSYSNKGADEVEKKRQSRTGGPCLVWEILLARALGGLLCQFVIKREPELEVIERNMTYIT